MKRLSREKRNKLIIVVIVTVAILAADWLGLDPVANSTAL